MKKINKKDNTSKILKKTVVFGILMLFTIAIMATDMSTKAVDNVEWELKLDFDEPGGAYDYVIFGEAPDANDGLPVDSYDEPKPPAPMPPYIRTWFNDNLAEPYNLILKDYRKHPDSYKVWNLTALWIPSDYNSSTTITISWDNNNITSIEYDSVELYKVGNSDHVSDMLVDPSYSFLCPANEVQHFQIICQGGTSTGETDTNEIPFLYLILIIIVIIICLLILYWKIIRR